jgi:FAD/FMN-containing dehydrogenase
MPRSLLHRRPRYSDSARFARHAELEIAVRAGGQNVAGTALTEGGVVIHVSWMKAVQFDPEALIARVGPGCSWGEVLPPRMTMPR